MSTVTTISLHEVHACLPVQATFLRSSASSEDPEHYAQLEALSAEELEIRCRRNGLSRRCRSLARGKLWEAIKELSLITTCMPAVFERCSCVGLQV